MAIRSGEVLAADLALAGELVRTAGELALRMRAQGLRGERKTSVSDIVTAADRAAEAYVLEELQRRRPQDGVLGEEGTDVTSASGRTWVIDPVDGTYNFFTGSSYWCSAIALRQDSGPEANGSDPEVLLGAVFHPQEDQLWVGGPSLETTRNGQPVRVADTGELGMLCAASYLHPRNFDRPATFTRWQRLVREAATYRALGSGSVDLGRVAMGQLGYWVHLSCPQWDWLPGKALVQGAGGTARMVSVDQDRWFLAGPAGTVDTLTELVRQPAD